MPMSSIRTMLLLSQGAMPPPPSRRPTTRVGTILPFLAVAFVLLLGHAAEGFGIAFATAGNSPQEHADEYRKLLEITEDKDGLESIRAIHQQLDDDNDGTIEPSETGDFIRVDLHPGYNRQQQQLRQKSFHKKDSEITVKDLWTTWWKSEVHNWTVDHTVEWLIKNCDLPQYENDFRRHKVTGSKLPLIAVGGTFLSKALGITNPIHRSKITLKAMDVVLFGPPKDSSSMLKDVILTTLLILAVSGCIYAYRQNKRARENLQRMINDMEALTLAERSLQEMQAKLSMKDSEIDFLQHQQNQVQSEVSDFEVTRLKEEIEILRQELQRAELEIEDRCWVAPTVLQHWLQLTYEIESSAYNAKRRAAEEQLEMAKDMCERLKKKRSSLVGAFVSTHGRSIDDVDRSILEAKTALLEVTKDLQERTARWRQIEMLCGCSIMNNAGIAAIEKVIRHVGAGRVAGGQIRIGGSSRLSGSMSQDDLLADDNFDAHSVAASSTHMTTMSMQLRERASVLPSSDRIGSSAVSVSGLSSTSLTKPRRHLPKQLSRESSKESSSSDEQSDKRGAHYSASVTGTPPPPATRKISPRVGPNGRMMVKSFSQDAASSMAAMAASGILASATSSSSVANPTTTSSNVSEMQPSSITSSISETVITEDGKIMHSATTGAAGAAPTLVTAKPPLPKSASSSVSSITTPTPTETSMTTSASQHSLRPPTLEEESQSDSGSLASELDASGVKKTKKKRSFFNFRRKKEKIP